ncbi:hypothetical protein CC85DRAFT_329237 [Cutaneotrichosporon oleaginosum]|uniref:Uncharacterized protein n=1 Tax=Cutaneotrichosporon oleaginosum TaxID=879819 RepID=A0A0J1B0W4_9TREE|nr:uncharacterized protein CC85DRAFT_329237 [Cutaneotrichosporon oleaginosum]KLT41249.1 hypothetical protein CC85DRAFT_329237 [Cutaneotrichosporon oleaginosum]TXT05511.1 hypothetical protein COLE_06831 [Cutaneotrichosporon oleaginosum]
MAIIEEAGSPHPRQAPVTIEELPDSRFSQPGPSTQPASAQAPSNLAGKLPSLAARLQPGEDTSEPTFQRTAESALRELGVAVASPEWDQLSREQQAVVFLPAIRLYSSSSSTLTPLIPTPPAASSLAIYLLSHPLRSFFTSHPHLSASTRARTRPHGGTGALDDMHDDESWKVSGIDNALAWCATQLSSSDVERHLNLLLPPTLTMMDNYQPPWRDAGSRVLGEWIDKIDPAELRRRGLDTLLLKSLTHTLSLHHDPPLSHVFAVTLKIAGNLDGEKKAEAYADIVDRALVAGWTYASSSAISVLVDIARNTEVLIGILGVGIARWLKSIIPALLAPLQHEPTPNRLGLYVANLNALLVLLRGLRGSGRVDRWRGQVLDVVARVWIQVGDYGYSGTDKETADTVLSLTRVVYEEIGTQCPSVKAHEFAQLRALDQRFAPLVM